MSSVLTETTAPASPREIPEISPSTAHKEPLRRGNLQVIDFSELDDLAPLREAWMALADRAADPNVFYAPWAFIPAVREFGADCDWKFVLVFREQENATQRPELCGFFPFIRGRGIFGKRQWTLWKHPFCYLTSPLVAAGLEAEVFKAVWAYLDRRATGAFSMVLPQIAGDGPLHHGIVTAIRDQLRAHFVRDEFVRAITTYPPSSHSRFVSAMAGKHIRELRRQRRKLSRLGDLEYRGTPTTAELGPWIDQFLALEADGWKARAGTAIAQDPHATRFFRDLLAGGLEANALRLEGLFLDDRPIAMKVNLLSPPAAFAFKIAFDERYRKYSPGVQLELESLDRFTEDTRITRADSCAIPGHSMIDRVWPDRRVIRSLVISRQKAIPEIILSMMPGLRASHRVMRRMFHQNAEASPPSA